MLVDIHRRTCASEEVKGHNLSLADAYSQNQLPQGPILFCVRCGGYAWGAANSLARKPPGVLYKCLLKGHPWRGSSSSDFTREGGQPPPQQQTTRPRQAVENISKIKHAVPAQPWRGVDPPRSSSAGNACARGKRFVKHYRGG